MFGLNKTRTKFGRWLDWQGLTQAQIKQKSKLGRATISKLCNDKDYRPKVSTVAKIKKVLQQLGRDVPPDDHFRM
jgi:transcriptional regulator with XRE-family HTH domain